MNFLFDQDISTTQSVCLTTISQTIHVALFIQFCKIHSSALLRGAPPGGGGHAARGPRVEGRGRPRRRVLGQTSGEEAAAAPLQSGGNSMYEQHCSV